MQAKASEEGPTNYPKIKFKNRPCIRYFKALLSIIQEH